MYGARIARSVTIQYGGSMNPANAAELLGHEDIDGGLIGGASLDAGTVSYTHLDVDKRQMNVPLLFRRNAQKGADRPRSDGLYPHTSFSMFS